MAGKVGIRPEGPVYWLGTTWTRKGSNTCSDAYSYSFFFLRERISCGGHIMSQPFIQIKECIFIVYISCI
jgi:hypothetical protein